MSKKLERWFKNFAKSVFVNLPFLRSIGVSIRFKRLYKHNFGKIKFQGQFFQDLIVFLFLQKKKEGFYIDIGANDGISGSNTYIFEQIGWKGICIEPNPDMYKKLKNIRKCDCYNVALSSETNDNVEFFKATADGLSGLNDKMEESHRKWAKEYGKIEIIKVKTVVFDKIMENYPNVKHIDFMSLDVEGYEISILESINFKKYTFGILTIEKNNPEKIKDIMEKNGYKLFMEIEADLMFIPK